LICGASADKLTNHIYYRFILSHPMSHARLKLDTCKIHSDATCGTTTKIFYTDWEVKEPIKISYFSVLGHKQWSYWLKHWSTTLSFFHSKTFPPCALRSMMKNICRVLGYSFLSRSLCLVAINHGMKDVRIIRMKEEGWMPTHSSCCWSTRKELDRNRPLRLLSYPSKSFYPPCNSFSQIDPWGGSSCSKLCVTLIFFTIEVS